MWKMNKTLNLEWGASVVVLLKKCYVASGGNCLNSKCDKSFNRYSMLLKGQV
jgi:hypothetical protein